MKWGDKVEWLYQLKAEGADPPALRNRPVFRDELRGYWEGFLRLSGSRPPGFSGMAAIPISEIKAYLEMFPEAEPETFIRLIQALDKVYRNGS
jgi:hypothetical protein